MASVRIWHETKGYSMKRSTAIRAIRNCAAKWVQIGTSIRSLTLQESIDARNEQAASRDVQSGGPPMGHAEIRGVRFDPPVNGIPATRREGFLIWEAQKFMEQVGVTA